MTFGELGYTPYNLYKYQLVLQVESDYSLPGDYIFFANYKINRFNR